MGDGLLHLEDGMMQQFTTADGLPDDGILGLREDDQGNLWASSRNGIFGCSLKQLNNYSRGQSAPLNFRQLGVQEGMADRECKGAGEPEIWRGPDGR